MLLLRTALRVRHVLHQPGHASDAVLFYFSCDPFGTNPYGSQVFGMRANGTGLRQLTNTHGYTQDASGAVAVALPFPFAWPGLQLRNQLAL